MPQDPLIYALTQGSSIRIVSGDCYVFLEESQGLLKVEPVVQRLWTRLAVGVEANELMALVDADGRSGQETVEQLQDSGIIAPILFPRSRFCPEVFDTVSVDNLCIALVFGDNKTRADLCSVFEHLLVENQRPSARVLITRSRSKVGFHLEGEETEWVGAASAGSVLKRVISEIVLDNVDSACIHGAVLASGDDALILLGDPGAGKSTLSVALSRAGFDLACDDVTVLQNDGMVRSLPFAVTLKDGSVPVLGSTGLKHVPSFSRPDGQRARYIAPSFGSTKVLKPRWVVKLDRRNGLAMRAEREDLQTQDAFAALLAGAWTASGRLDNGDFEGLATVVDGAHCFSLRYEECDAAASMLRTICLQQTCIPTDEYPN